MGIRLYDSAWVKVEGRDEPFRVHKDAKNPALFNIGDFQYDIDGRPVGAAPALESLHSLQSAREAGLRTTYDRDVDPAI